MGGTCPGQAALVPSIVPADGYHAGCGVPKPWGGTEAAQPPHMDAAVYQTLVPAAWGSKIQQKHPGCLEKSMPGTSVLPPRTSVPKSQRTLCRAVCPPRPAVSPGCAENRAGGPCCEEAERCRVFVCPAAFRCPACSTLPLVSSWFCFPAADLFIYFHVAAFSSRQLEATGVASGADRASGLVLVFLLLVLLVQALVAPLRMQRAGAACGVRPGCSLWK